MQNNIARSLIFISNPLEKKQFKNNISLHYMQQN
jgi:hypothetical protein